MHQKHWIRTLAVMIVAVSTTAVAMGADRDFRRSFDVRPGEAVRVDVSAADVTIRTHRLDRVEIVARLEGSADAIDDYDVTAEKSSDAVELKAKHRSRRGWSGRRFSARFDILVPQRFDVSVRTSGGDVEIADLAGEVDVRTSGGEVQVGKVAGTLKVRTSGGDVEVRSVDGVAQVSSSGGNLDLGEMGNHLSAGTSGGDITVKSVRGNVEAKTSGGSISIGSVGGSIDLRTSGGNIRAQLEKAPTADSRLRTSGGSITLTLPSSIDARIVATASGGSVKSDVPITVSGKISRSRLEGTIGRGGPLLELSTSGGSVHIRAR